MNDEDKEIEKDIGYRPLLLWGVGVLLTTIIVIVVVKYFFKDWTKSGPFGDTFGAVNALFSGLAFAGIIYTILLQRNELKLQRIELRQTRKELAGQKREFEIQNETLKRQRFENGFFNLLNMLFEIRDGLNINGEKKGTELLDYLCEKLKERYKAIPKHFTDLENYKKHNTQRIDSFKSEIIQAYNIDNFEDLLRPEVMSKAAYVVLFKIFHSQLGHYFRSLYHLLKFINDYEEREIWDLDREAFEDNLDATFAAREKDKIRVKYKAYSQYVQAQMSSSELILLFYDALFFPKMKKYVYHYDLIENVSAEDLLNPINDLKFYYGETIDNIEYEKVDLKSRQTILKP